MNSCIVNTQGGNDKNLLTKQDTSAHNLQEQLEGIFKDKYLFEGMT